MVDWLIIKYSQIDTEYLKHKSTYICCRSPNPIVLVGGMFTEIMIKLNWKERHKYHFITTLLGYCKCILISILWNSPFYDEDNSAEWFIAIYDRLRTICTWITNWDQVDFNKLYLNGLGITTCDDADTDLCSSRDFVNNDCFLSELFMLCRCIEWFCGASHVFQ